MEGKEGIAVVLIYGVKIVKKAKAKAKARVI